MKRLTASAVAMALLAGCATQGGQTGQMDNKTANAGAGAAIGCVGGAVLAHLAKGKAAAGCAAGAVLGGLIGYEKARQEEIEAAKKAQAETVAMVSGARSRPVVTETVEVKDKATGEVKPVQALKEFSVDLPLSQKGTPEFNNAMDKVKKLAERYADERGMAEITVAMNPVDAKAQKVTDQSVTLKTPSGKGTIAFAKKADGTVDRGYERITVRAKNDSRIEA